MRNLLFLPLVMVAALSARGKALESTAARADAEDAADNTAGARVGAKNILNVTSDKVDEAMAAGKEALNAAIEQGEGQQPTP
jgi:hypothetical protein